MKDKVLSIQSRVAYGYVGGNIADLILQLQGIDIISVPTVLLSTHAENKLFMGESLSPTLFSKLLEGIDLLDARNDINYMITGYFAEKRLMEIAYHFIKRLKTQTPFTYICDPVMGDYRAGGLYVKEEVADFYIQHLIELSDIITPNQFELEHILKEKIDIRSLTGIYCKTIVTRIHEILIDSDAIDNKISGSVNIMGIVNSQGSPFKPVRKRIIRNLKRI